MTCLIQGCTVLKSSPILGSVIKWRYRLVLSNHAYLVHSEYHDLNGTSGEGLLYDGPSLDTANRIFEKYSK